MRAAGWRTFGMKDQRNHLDPEQRAAVIRETFEAITAVGFMKWKAEELMGFGYEVSEEDRQHYFREFEKDFFPDFQKLTANASDDRLLDAMEFWTDKANAMGLKEWQEVLSEGQGAQPWYEALAREVAADERFPPVSQEQAGRSSVLGYRLPEPCPEPSPAQEQSKDRSHGR
jgi:hypothetical protein